MLAPFGVLNNEYTARLKGLLTAPGDWPAGQESNFENILRGWLDEVVSSIWPAWENGAWVGDAASDMASTTAAELVLAANLYHGQGGQPDVLNEVPAVPPAPDNVPRNHEWHYKIEDALVLDPKYLYVEAPEGGQPSYDFVASNNIGSNFLVYDPTFDIKQFEQLFWGRMRRIEPPIFDIKQRLQRPRPWTAATALDVEGFRWVVAGGFFVTHTGVHPSLLSGHCIQGILGGCSVFEGLMQQGAEITPSTKRAIQKYMVDWGDRRVFAGVHYMTDNVGSWTLARRMIPHLFSNPEVIEALAVEAITRHSQVFDDIVEHFPQNSPAKSMLLQYFPEGVPVA